LEESLTHLALVKEPELSPNGKVSQIHLKITVNQRSTTVEDAEQARRRFLTRLANSLQWDAKNWAYTHQGLLSRLGMQIAGAGQRLQEMVQAANLAVLNTIEGYGHVFERLMDGWEGGSLDHRKGSAGGGRGGGERRSHRRASSRCAGYSRC